MPKKRIRKRGDNRGVDYKYGCPLEVRSFKIPQASWDMLQELKIILGLSQTEIIHNIITEYYQNITKDM